MKVMTTTPTSTSVINITANGTTSSLNPRRVTAKDAMVYRSVTGQSVRAAYAAVVEDPDIDIIVGLLWLARRQSGDRVELTKFLDAFDYDSASEISIDASTPATEVSDPEA